MSVPLETFPADKSNKHNDVSHNEDLGDHQIDQDKVGIDRDTELEQLGQGLTGYEGLTQWQALKYLWMPTLYAFGMTFSSVCDGYQVAMGGSMVANVGFAQKFGTGVNAAGATFLESNTLANWGLAFSISQCIGQFTIGPIADKIGRRYAFWYFGIILAISLIFESTVMNWKGWLAGRAFGGLGIGSMQAFVPIYVGEIAPTHLRGAVNVSYTFWFAGGQLIANIVLQRTSKSNPLEYKAPIFSQWAMIGVMFIIYLFLPETPTWCIRTGRLDRARKITRKIYRGVQGFDEDRYLQQISLILEHEKAVATENKALKWYAPLVGTNRIRFLCVFIPLFSSGWLGLTIFFSQVAYFFQQTGFADPFLVTCIVNGLLMAGSLAVAVTIDKLGRRKPYLAGASTLLLVCVMVGALSLVEQTPAVNNGLIALTCLWVTVYPLQAGTASAWAGEVPSARLKARTTSLAFGLNTGINIGVGYLFPYMLNKEAWNWGLKTAWFFVGTGAPCVVVAFFLAPETSNRTVGEIDELFENHVKPWRFSSYKTQTQIAMERQDNAGIQEVPHVSA